MPRQLSPVQREFEIRRRERELHLERVLLQRATVHVDLNGPPVGTSYLIRARDMVPEGHMCVFEDGSQMPPGDYYFQPVEPSRPAVRSTTVQ